MSTVNIQSDYLGTLETKWTSYIRGDACTRGRKGCHGETPQSAALLYHNIDVTVSVIMLLLLGVKTMSFQGKSVLFKLSCKLKNWQIVIVLITQWAYRNERENNSWGSSECVRFGVRGFVYQFVVGCFINTNWILCKTMSNYTNSTAFNELPNTAFRGMTHEHVYSRLAVMHAYCRHGWLLQSLGI